MFRAKFRAVCFDMWGTLAEGDGGDEWIMLQNTLKATEINPETFCNEGIQCLLLHPGSIWDGIKTLADRLKLKARPEVVEKANQLWWEIVKKSQIYPETLQVLSRLKNLGLKMVIISNTDSESFYYEVKKISLAKYFERYFISAETGSLKQDGEMFRLAQNYLKLPKSQVLMVDDSYAHGVIPARRFGWSAIWLARNKKITGKYTVNNLKGIFDFL